MRAITVVPGRQGSVALADVQEPPLGDGAVLVQTQAIGICGTDLEIINGDYGWAPPGEERLIIGHESLGQVAEAAPGTGFDAGDLVVGIVRRPDPVPCPACAAGDWDMCTNGRYTERGIKAQRIMCLTGVSSAGAESTVDPGLLNRNMVLQNSVLFGSVNANRRHYELAAGALAQADPRWLAGLITRQVPVGRWADAYTRGPDDIKTILDFSDGSP
jgi:D-arabinose 1-dehydrogenase-like Zn-dependent alcohol dehydrogenase